MKQTIEVDLKWYETRQNNSGGHYYVNDSVAQFVLVQAASAAEATAKMESITEDSGYDWCECCGERWYISLDESDGSDEPSIYGKPISEYEAWSSNQEARLHHYNGVIESVQLNTRK